MNPHVLILQWSVGYISAGTVELSICLLILEFRFVACINIVFVTMPYSHVVSFLKANSISSLVECTSIFAKNCILKLNFVWTPMVYVHRVDNKSIYNHEC